jgi:hypothetical protein
MKTLALALTLAATLAAPLAAPAATQSDSGAAPATTFLIVDSQTGRTLGTLVPVDGNPHELHLIGNVAARGAEPFGRTDAMRAPTPAPAALTPAQIAAATEAALLEQFYAPPDAGIRGW